jgi:hypothetical protein
LEPFRVCVDLVRADRLPVVAQDRRVDLDDLFDAETRFDGVLALALERLQLSLRRALLDCLAEMAVERVALADSLLSEIRPRERAVGTKP